MSPITSSEALLSIKPVGGTLDETIARARRAIRTPPDRREHAEDMVKERLLTTKVRAAQEDLGRRRMPPIRRLVLEATYPDAAHDVLTDLGIEGPGQFDKEGFVLAVLDYLDREEGPMASFVGNLVDQVVEAEHLSLSQEEKERVVREVRRSDISLRPGTARRDVVKIIDQVKRHGELDERIKEWVDDRREVDPEAFTDDISHRMREMWIRRRFGRPTAADVQSGKFDEHFITLYNEAVTTREDGADPLDRVSGRAAGASSPWDFTVETFEEIEEQGVEPKNILAAGAIDYIYELGERMGIFRLAEAMVLNWSAGAIDVVDQEPADMLYRYWKQLERRSTAEERGMLYRRVLNKGKARVLDRMVPNEHFPGLWHRLLAEVADFIEKSEKVEAGSSASSPVKRSRIYQATKELQYNLTEYCTGMAHIQAQELYAQLSEAIEIFRHEDVIAHFGGSRRKNMWTVIERLSKSEFGDSPPIGAIRSLAVDGNRLFQWVAHFDQTTVTEDAFEEFLEAAETYILNRALVDEVLAGTGQDGASEDEFEDDFEDDFDDFEGDFEDEFGDDDF